MFIGMQKHPALNSVKLHYILPNKKNTSQAKQLYNMTKHIKMKFHTIKT